MQDEIPCRKTVWLRIRQELDGFDILLFQCKRFYCHLEFKQSGKAHVILQNVLWKMAKGWEGFMNSSLQAGENCIVTLPWCQFLH